MKQKPKLPLSGQIALYDIAKEMYLTRQVDWYFHYVLCLIEAQPRLALRLLVWSYGTAWKLNEKFIKHAKKAELSLAEMQRLSVLGS